MLDLRLLALRRAFTSAPRLLLVLGRDDTPTPFEQLRFDEGGEGRAHRDRPRPQRGAGSHRELGGQRRPIRHGDIADGNPGAGVHLRHSVAEIRVLPLDRYGHHLPR